MNNAYGAHLQDWQVDYAFVKIYICQPTKVHSNT